MRQLITRHTLLTVRTIASLRQQLPDGKQFARRLGPGLITGAADDDPSGIATY